MIHIKLSLEIVMAYIKSYWTILPYLAILILYFIMTNKLSEVAKVEIDI